MCITDAEPGYGKIVAVGKGEIIKLNPRLQVYRISVVNFIIRLQRNSSVPYSQEEGRPYEIHTHIQLVISLLGLIHEGGNDPIVAFFIG